MKKSFYKIDLHIDVVKQFISVDMELDYPILQEKTNKISLMLHENLRIKNIEGEKIKNYNFDPKARQFLPEAGILTLNMNEELSKGKLVKIKLSYEGHLDVFQPYGDNRLTEEWVELGLYFPWFPLNIEQCNASNITYDINVRINEDYKVFGMGNIHKKNEYWHITKHDPTMDIIVMASKSVKVDSIKEEGLKVKIYYDENNKIISKHGLWILNKYKQWFGKINEDQVSIVFAPGGAYARKGFIVLGKETLDGNDYNVIDYFTNMLGHEFAHLWWLNSSSNTWEAWLDEAFAEYSALRLLRERFGEKEFQKALVKRIERSIDTPPIKDLDMNYENRKAVIYDKGCLLLYKLENKVGQEKFVSLLKEVRENNVKNTEEFLKVLTKSLGEKISEEFHELLCDF